MNRKIGFADAVRKAVALDRDCWAIHYYCDAGWPHNRLATYMHSREIVKGPAWVEGIRTTMMMEGKIKRA